MFKNKLKQGPLFMAQPNLCQNISLAKERKSKRQLEEENEQKLSEIIQDLKML